ncbi:amidase family protein [Hoeflea prorocentri]|uniref:Amidase family protein n=1 Tax=Hoeflea prorocentri TaxID=1922333 RepID=A0A9X3ZHT9_9HYPH|nr:amidase family protein [Hoeflea prorocentri]MCY6381090.1 amidase family protein [Hoeflea prorocentri]MDA5398890.1 amidase family protein [Hoeflea prorocentri]
MTEKPLWQLSACELATLISDGRISAREAVTAAVDRMRERNGAINAVVDDLGDEAIAEAKTLDEALKSSGPVGPLHGVPVTIKENVDQTGRATPNGVSAFKDIIAPADSPVVRNFKQAGAIVIGRTNTPEFSFRATTDNELHGRTFNPWNDWASAGGSSGGAAAAVMCGMGALAHGNDIAGSLRYPPAATGSMSVKPGLGRVPAYNPSAAAERGLLAQLMSVQGVIAREVRDVRLALRELMRPDPHDPWMVPVPFDGPALDGPIKVGFTKDMFEFEVHPAVEQALDTARDALADAGYHVEEVEPPLIREIAAEAGQSLFGEVRTLLEDDIKRYGSETFKAIFQDYFRFFGSYEGADLARALAKRTHYARQWSLFLEDYPLVLTPFLPQPTYSWNRDTEGLEGVSEVLGSAIYGASMNYLGLPAGNIAANYNDGLPVGVQIIGRRFREDLILDACEAVEQRIGVMAHKLFERG